MLLGKWTAIAIDDFDGGDGIAGYGSSVDMPHCFSTMKTNVRFDKFTLTFKADGTFENYQGYARGSYFEYPGHDYDCDIRIHQLNPRTYDKETYDYRKLESNTLYIPIWKPYGALTIRRHLTATLQDENTLVLTESASHSYVLKRN